MRRRVVITGMGMVNPMGHEVSTVWDGLLKGESGVALTTIFDTYSEVRSISTASIPGSEFVPPAGYQKVD